MEQTLLLQQETVSRSSNTGTLSELGTRQQMASVNQQNVARSLFEYARVAIGGGATNVTWNISDAILGMLIVRWPTTRTKTYEFLPRKNFCFYGILHPCTGDEDSNRVDWSLGNTGRKRRMYIQCTCMLASLSWHQFVLKSVRVSFFLSIFWPRQTDYWYRHQGVYTHMYIFSCVTVSSCIVATITVCAILWSFSVFFS